MQRNDTNELTCKNRTGLTDLESKLKVAKGAEWGAGIVREFGTDMYIHCHI